MKPTFLVLFISSFSIMFAQTASHNNNFTDKFGIEMVYVKGGSFTMGCTPEQRSTCNPNENPAHKVTLSDYYICRFEVTQAQWDAVMGDNPSYFKEELNNKRFLNMDAVRLFVKNLNTNTGGKYVVPNKSECFYDGRYHIGDLSIMAADWDALMTSYKGDILEYFGLPVEQVSWEDVQIFIEKLNKLTGKSYRLPTEAEWEYAARGGNKSKGYKYAGDNSSDVVAWYYENTGNFHSNAANWNSEETIMNQTQDVGTKLPNELGIYDMSGNVWEWCSDWYGEYSILSQKNPQGPSNGSFRVFRGGAWYNSAGRCRVSNRNSGKESTTNYDLGFRLALSL